MKPFKANLSWKEPSKIFPTWLECYAMAYVLCRQGFFLPWEARNCLGQLESLKRLSQAMSGFGSLVHGIIQIRALVFVSSCRNSSMVTSHLGSEFEHIKTGLWKVRISVRSRRVDTERWDVTTRMGPCCGFSVGWGSRHRGSKIGEELQCHQEAEGSQSSRD